MGYDVVAWDPGPGAQARLSAFSPGGVARPWRSSACVPARRRTGCGSPSRLAEAVAGAEFVQESRPEVLDAKIALLAEIDRLTPPEVVVASSTSGFMMTDMAARTRTPAGSWWATRSTRRT